MINSGVLEKLKVQVGMSPIVAIQRTREYLDSQPDGLKAANSLLLKMGLPVENNQRKAYVFLMSAIENIVQSKPLAVKQIALRAEESINKIKDLIGKNAFIETTTPNKVKNKKKASKRFIAMEIFQQYRDKGDKFVIEKISETLDVTKPNAYTYFYLIRKDLKLI